MEDLNEMLEEKKGVIKLSDEEKNIIRAYQEIMDRERMIVANLRMQYLSSERQVLMGIEKIQNDTISHLKMLLRTKGVPEDENWVFDPTTFSFVQK